MAQRFTLHGLTPWPDDSPQHRWGGHERSVEHPGVCTECRAERIAADKAVELQAAAGRLVD